MRRWPLEAQDGADDDGGTLYTLYDEQNVPLFSASWPQPLEAVAAAYGAQVAPRYPPGGEEIDLELLDRTIARRRKAAADIYEVLRRRVTEVTEVEKELGDLDSIDREAVEELDKQERDIIEKGEDELLDELLEEASAVASRDANKLIECRVDGCTNDAPARGRYTGVCAEHRKASRELRREEPEVVNDRAEESVPEPQHELVELALAVAAQHAVVLAETRKLYELVGDLEGWIGTVSQTLVDA